MFIFWKKYLKITEILFLNITRDWLVEIWAHKPKPVTPVCLCHISGSALVKRIAAEITAGGNGSREKQRESNSLDASQHRVWGTQDSRVYPLVDVREFNIHQQLTHILQARHTLTILTATFHIQ